MILITGAGGKTGRTLIKELSQRNRICALVFHEKHVSVVEALGAAKIIVGDMRDKSTIHSAMRGVRSIYHICPNMHPDEFAIGKLIIEEARKAGVEHFVYHSVLHPQTEKMQHHWNKLRVEELIFESGLAFTILQPAPYMQNLLADWDSIVIDGILHVPYSVSAKFSFVDLKDVGTAARIVLNEPGHTNAIYELAGTEPLSHIEIAEILSQVLGRDVRAVSEDIGGWKLRSTGLSMYAIENLIRMFEYYDRWGLSGNPNVLKWLLKKEPTTLSSFIERTMKESNVLH